MGCFLACFGASKDEKRRKIKQQDIPVRGPEHKFENQYKTVQTNVVAKLETPEESRNIASDTAVKNEQEQLSLSIQEKPEEQLNLDNQDEPEKQLSSVTRKRVTFDSNIREYEHVCDEKAPDFIRESEEEADKGFTDDVANPGKSVSSSDSGLSTLSSAGLYPPSNRYQNCRECDDEDEDLYDKVSDLDEDEDGHDEDNEEDSYGDGYSDNDYHPSHMQEFSAGSFTSLESRTNCSISHSMKDDGLVLDGVSPVIEAKTSAGLICGARDRGAFVHSVLNPVENTTQWKAVKARGTPALKQKENFPLDQSSKRFSSKTKLNFDEPKNDHEVPVDASLSNWLVSSQKTPTGKAAPVGFEPISSGASASSFGSNSVRSYDERQILGALTMEELKQFSALSSPRRSPSRTPAEKPIVGIDGAHWNSITPEDSHSANSFKGLPNTTSKYREDKRVNWHSTPFETRLERALNRGAAAGESYAKSGRAH